MKILGIGGSDHDFSAVILDNGKVVVAIEDERVTGIKHGRGKWYSIPTQPSLYYCLEEAELEIGSMDYIFSNLHLEKYAYSQKIENIHSISHHLSHAAGAFFPSPFSEAAVVVIDGAGSRVSETPSEVELETISFGVGKNNKVDIEVIQTGKRKIATCFWRYMTSNSIGSFYEAVTEAIGFGSYGAGKTMGLASYGDSSLYEEMMEFVEILPEGRFHFDPYSGFFDWILSKLNGSKNSFKIRAMLAAAAQRIFEEAILNTMKYIYRCNKLDYLCYSGGCALNSVANTRILKETPFKQLFIYPATADNGTAIGAAYYGYYHILDNPREPQNPTEIGSIVYTGKEYPEVEILEVLNNHPVFFYRPENLYDDVAWRLYNQEVIGWFQGRSEIGPRALGNRSILADPTFSQMRDYINLKIKYRETFRPLAPVVIEEEAKEYFELDQPSPFMLLVAPVKKEYRRKLAAVTHIDGTSRLQTVNIRTNERLHKLLAFFKRLRGHPILLNTSFNVQGQPIVETPEQALKCFLETELNTLVLGDYIVEKHTPWANRKLPEVSK